MRKVLVVDDEAGIRESLRILLSDICEVVTAPDVPTGLDTLEREDPDLILLDLVMPLQNGLDFLGGMVDRGCTTPVIVVSATTTVSLAVEAMKRGAKDFLTKPFEPEALRPKVMHYLEHRALETEVKRLRNAVERRSRMGDMIGRSDVMQEVFASIERVAKSRASVLITGESGTGKELVARAIHDRSPRAKSAFIALNCAAIPENLIESELFGHERGAFTDARERRIGKFEAASGGTLFLDEIGELAPKVQAKLLRALQEKRIERLGGTECVDVDVRILAATNRELEAEIAAGRFRSDLYYRIHVLPIALPPLRERREDIRYIAEYLLEKGREEEGTGPTSLSRGTLTAMERYTWPGNVRELANSIEHGRTLATGEVLTTEDLPEAVLSASHLEHLRDEVCSGGLSFDAAVSDFERNLIKEALVRNRWNQTQTSEQLGLTRRLLKIKMDRYGLASQDLISE
jgi:DNA-binding NtrC family response regulator